MLWWHCSLKGISIPPVPLRRIRVGLLLSGHVRSVGVTALVHTSSSVVCRLSMVLAGKWHTRDNGSGFRRKGSPFLARGNKDTPNNIRVYSTSLSSFESCQKRHLLKTVNGNRSILLCAVCMTIAVCSFVGCSGWQNVSIQILTGSCIYLFPLYGYWVIVWLAWVL